MTSASPEIISITNLNAHIHLVEIQWRLFEETKEMVSFSTKYILGKSNQQFKILGIFEIDEQEKISQLEASKKAAKT